MQFYMLGRFLRLVYVHDGESWLPHTARDFHMHEQCVRHEYM